LLGEDLTEEQKVQLALFLVRHFHTKHYL